MIRWELTQVVTSGYDDFGFIGIQPAAFGTKDGADSGMGAYQQILPLGYYARPLDRTDDRLACLAICGLEGGRGYAWTIQDPRYAAKCPPLSKGSRAIVNDAGAFIVLDYDKETSIWYQPYSTGGTTKAHKFTMGKDGAGVPVVELKGGEGQYIQFQNSKAVFRGSGNAAIKLDGDNCDLNGTTNIAGSLTVALGTVPVALSGPLVTYLTALEAVLATVSAATVPSTSAAVAAFVAATAALKTALVSLTLKAT